MDGSFGQRISQMERKAAELFDRIAAAIDKPDADPREVFAFWKSAAARWPG